MKCKRLEPGACPLLEVLHSSPPKLAQMTPYSGYVKTDVTDVNTSHTPEEGAHTPNWPNGLVIVIIIPSHTQV